MRRRNTLKAVKAVGENSRLHRPDFSSCPSGLSGLGPVRFFVLFFSCTVTGRLLLGNATITPSFTWVIPAGVEVIGLGAYSTTTINTTTIVAAQNFSGPIIQMGYGTPGNANPQFGVKIRNLALDCAGNTGCEGIFNNIAEEGSGVEDVTINNAPVGIEIDLPPVNNPATSPYAANSGPYRNITIQYPTCGTCGSMGVLLIGNDGGQIVRGLDNITISGCSGTGILIEQASTRISNSTISCTGTAIQVGDGIHTTHNVEIENVFLSGTASPGLRMDNCPPPMCTGQDSSFF